MSSIEVFLIAISLSCDAFAVSLSKGLSTSKVYLKNILIVGIYFGLFQALMPIIGYYLSKNLGVYLVRYSHLIGFIILTIIGISMIIEKDEEENDLYTPKIMLPLAIGTSIDALAVGVTFSLVLDSIFHSSILIGITTFILSSVGVILGDKIKNSINIPAKKIGGIILLLLGLNMLFEYLS
ncbi:MAG: manganese efflux pump [Erysipelotrichales bacterium]|nr:manganese efflux pump [Erysipelotrichales bacterium]